MLGRLFCADKLNKNNRFSVLLAVGSTASPLNAKAQTGQISVRAVEATALFGKYCLQAPPSLASIDHRASNAGFQVFQNRSIGPGARQKEWLVPASSKNAPLLLSVESGPSRDGTADVTICGVSALGAPGRALQQALSDDPRLGQPAKVISPAPSGGTLVFWPVRYAGASQVGNAQVMLAYDVPGSKVNPINLTFKRPR